VEKSDFFVKKQKFSIEPKNGENTKN